jgi:acyl carrier protein
VTTSAPPDLDEVSAQLCAMCREILEVPEVAPGDDLFDLDPDSLSLTRLNNRIQDAWSVEVPVDVFYDTETIADLAQAIVTLQRKD